MSDLLILAGFLLLLSLGGCGNNEHKQVAFQEQLTCSYTRNGQTLCVSQHFECIQDYGSDAPLCTFVTTEEQVEDKQ